MFSSDDGNRVPALFARKFHAVGEQHFFDGLLDQAALRVAGVAGDPFAGVTQDAQGFLGLELLLVLVGLVVEVFDDVQTTGLDQLEQAGE